jgi:ribonuclease HII
MPWLVGIDEAGYGPNLGPLVQTAIAVRAPTETCLWQQLATVVRKAGGKADGRIIIDDSKLVHTPSDGLARLEHGVFATLNGALKQPIGTFIDRFGCLESRTGIKHEAWFDPNETGPVAIPEDQVTPSADRFEKAIFATNIEVRVLGVVATPAPQFNKLVDRHDSKAGPLAEGLTTLLRALDFGGDAEQINVVVDKQGGRNAYAPLLQSALPDCWIHCQRESAEASEYSTTMNDAPVRFRFIPRADQESFSVALASMLAKYLRERFMGQFNRYWQKHVPGVKPTAGYPLDAKRFYAEIRPAMAKLNVSEEMVWRKR